jgi:uncharacterized repeat protein (TIGR02543 family)
MNMRKLLLLLATVLCSVSSFADNYLSMDPIRMKAGETKQVSINLTNDVSITAFQMDLYLPAGVTIDKDADDEYLIDLATRTTTKKHTVTEAIQTDGAMRIVVYSSSNKVFTGTEGAILNLTLKADASIALGSYTVKIDNVVMSELENTVVTELKPAAKTTTLAIVADYAITSSAATAGGTVTGAGTYSSDQDVTLTATPETGYHFVSWSNGSTANPLVFKPTKSEEINATFAPNKYAVKYEVDGTVVHTDSVNYGAAVTAWSNPTKEGYTFSGWSTIPSTMPANDVTVTGSFTVNSYSLIYMVDGAEYKKVSVTYGATITPEAVPTKEGYTFSGWSTIPTTMPAKDVTVTGTFAVNTYKVTFTIDGTILATKDVTFGSAITPPDAPAKEGYTFAGWSTIPTTMPAKDITITGSYTVNSYSLIYMVDGAEYKKVSVTYGATITPEAVPTKEGYTFSGWSTIPTTMPANDVTVTGSFAVNSYSLIYMVDGTEYKKVSVAYGTTITPEAVPTKEGYTFSGWSTVPSTMPAKDVTVTGTFSINTYKVTFTIEGTTIATKDVTFGSAITAPDAPAKEGYTFAGWSTIPSTMPAKDITITGSYTVNTYKVTFTIDGTTIATRNVAFGGTITAPDAPAKEGYTFAGWSTIPTTMPAKDITITGSYTVNSYSLIYMVDGAEYKKVSVTYGATITPEAMPTKEGYTFSGWSTIPTTMPAKDVTVTGTFSINTYKVTFTIDGTILTTKDVTFGSAITAPDAPAKEGYTFAGWSTIPTTMPAKDITITGSYTVNSYNLIYIVDGLEYKKVSVAFGTAITAIAGPTKEGYTFTGWSNLPTTMPPRT